MYNRIFNLIHFAGAPGLEIGRIRFREMPVKCFHLLQVEWPGSTPAKDHRLIPSLIDDSIPIQSARNRHRRSMSGEGGDELGIGLWTETHVLGDIVRRNHLQTRMPFF